MNKQILEILTKYQNATCSDAELKLLDEWYHQLEISNQTISNQTINDNDVVIFTDSMLKEFREKVGQGVKIIPFYRQPIFRMVAAASVLFVIFFGTYFYVTKPSSKTLVNQSIVKKDVMAPSSSKATITLANGQIVALDGISSGTLVASQGAVNVLDYCDAITVGIDFTARDLQAKLKEKGLPWEKAKAFDDSAVLGKWILLTSAILDQPIHFSLHKNATVVQDGDSSLMIFSLATILESITEYFTIYPGDLIYTGTPVGVGPTLKGDVFEGYFEANQVFSIKVNP